MAKDKFVKKMERGDKEYAHKNYQEALKNYVTASKIEPKNENLWIKIAYCYIAARDIKSATDAVKQALKVNPSSVAARKIISIIKSQQVRETDTEVRKGGEEAEERVIRSREIASGISIFRYLKIGGKVVSTLTMKAYIVAISSMLLPMFYLKMLNDIDAKGIIRNSPTGQSSVIWNEWFTGMNSNYFILSVLIFLTFVGIFIMELITVKTHSKRVIIRSIGISMTGSILMAVGAGMTQINLMAMLGMRQLFGSDVILMGLGSVIILAGIGMLMRHAHFNMLYIFGIMAYSFPFVIEILRPNYRYGIIDLGAMLTGMILMAASAFIMAYSLARQYFYISLPITTARRKFYESRYGEAIERLAIVIKKNPKSEIAYQMIGLCYSKLKDLDNAIENLSKAVELDPMYDAAWDELGTAKRKKGELEEAAKCYQKALDINPNYVVSMTNMGNLHAEKGELDKALLMYDRSLKTDPYYPIAFNNRGAILLEKGKNEMALKSFEAAIALNKTYIAAWKNRGRVLEKLGRNTEAKEAKSLAERLLAKREGRVVPRRPDPSEEENISAEEQSGHDGDEKKEGRDD